MTPLILIIAFILDGTVSLLITPNSFFFPLFTLVSIVIIYKFRLSSLLYLVTCTIAGLIYGVTYNYLFLDTGLFILIGIFIIIFFQRIKPNTLSILIASIITVIIYRILTYITTLFVTHKFNIYFLIKGIYSSLTINVLYILIINLIVNKFNKKHNWF